MLASLNLPAAIEDLSGQTIPKSMLDKSAVVKEKGGLASIDTYMQNLPELLQRNREILDEVRKRSTSFDTFSPLTPLHGKFPHFGCVKLYVLARDTCSV